MPIGIPPQWALLFMKNERSMLAEEEFLQIPPTLACAIGLNEAIVLQRLYWLLKYPQNGKEMDGHRWIYNTLSEWKRQFFPFWSEDTIMRIFNSLEGRKLIVCIQPEGSKRRKYYRVSQAAIANLTFERFEQIPNPQLATFEAGKLQPSQTRKLRPSYYIRKSGTKRHTKSLNNPLRYSGTENPILDENKSSKNEEMASEEEVSKAQMAFKELCDSKKGEDLSEDDDSSFQKPISQNEDL